MDFVDKLNSNLNSVKIEKEIISNQRNIRYNEILELVLEVCEKVGFTNMTDRERNSKKYRWICIVVDINLTSMMLIDQIDENDIPMNSDMIREDNYAKAKVIVEKIAVYTIESVPKFTWL
ncbi:hypothetical protein HJ101_17835 [Vibrio parahaemolyticus]|nr:hypothetical protein [Vibrio parahaemolyticus]MBE4142120.1 hypothetical protein [Vibrio parahaemolyticus]HCG7040487.1 hypothetical protein [Vibrio parahaemolyticus]